MKMMMMVVVMMPIMIVIIVIVMMFNDDDDGNDEMITTKYPFRQLREALSENPLVVKSLLEPLAQVIAESPSRLVGYSGPLWGDQNRFRCALQRLDVPHISEDTFGTSAYIMRKSLSRKFKNSLNSALLLLREHADLVSGPLIHKMVLHTSISNLKEPPHHNFVEFSSKDVSVGTEEGQRSDRLRPGHWFK